MFLKTFYGGNNSNITWPLVPLSPHFSTPHIGPSQMRPGPEKPATFQDDVDKRYDFNFVVCSVACICRFCVLTLVLQSVPCIIVLNAVRYRFSREQRWSSKFILMKLCQLISFVMSAYTSLPCQFSECCAVFRSRPAVGWLWETH